MIDNFPYLAPICPPVTGASTLETSKFLARLAILVANPGELVVWSTIIELNNHLNTLSS